MEKKTSSLSKKTIMGYSFGGLTDAASYNFITMYLLFFLTTMAGLSAGKAGIIMSTAGILEAVYVLFLGPISDNTKSKYGRRRPYMLAGAVILIVALVLLFRVVDLGETGNVAYYFIALMLYWIGYMTFLTPYNALGPEMTDNYDDRTRLRTPATIVQNVGNIIGMSLPLVFVAKCVQSGAAESDAWGWFGIVLGAACGVAALITWLATKGKELPYDKIEAVEREKNPIKTYWQILKLKPSKWIIALAICFYAAYMVFMSGMVYLAMYAAGLSEAQVSTATLINIIVGMVFTVIISMIATRFDKKTGMAICFVAAAIGMLVMYFVGVTSFAMMVLVMVLFGIGNGAFWLLLYPVTYDLAEVYEYKYGERKEASILAIFGLIASIAAAIGTQVLTISLTIIGFDPTLPTLPAETVHGISTVIICIPVAAFILSALCCIANPLSKKTYALLLEQLEKKRAGEETDETGLERIL